MTRHYTKRGLDTRARIRASASVEPNGCWFWQRTTNAEGYGQIRLGGKMVYAHRASYEANVGPIPDGLTIDHTCRNPSCVNPHHLEPVTMRENLMRGTGVSAVNAAKTECKNGHPLSGSNLYITPSGRRSCRKCNAAAAARVKAKRERASA